MECWCGTIKVESRGSELEFHCGGNRGREGSSFSASSLPNKKKLCALPAIPAARPSFHLSSLLYWNLEVEVKTRVACILNEYHVCHWSMSMADRTRFDQTTLAVGTACHQKGAWVREPTESNQSMATYYLFDQATYGQGGRGM